MANRAVASAARYDDQDWCLAAVRAILDEEIRAIKDASLIADNVASHQSDLPMFKSEGQNVGAQLRRFQARLDRAGILAAQPG